LEFQLDKPLATHSKFSRIALLMLMVVSAGRWLPCYAGDINGSAFVADGSAD
jgi:hypothetical protein